MHPWTWRRQLLDELALPTPPILWRDPRAARGLRLAQDVHAPEAIPALPISAMDGFAARWADLRRAVAEPLPVVLDIPAGPGGVLTLPDGAAARIMTGAPLPEGADTVVPVELTDADPVGPAPAHVRLSSGATEALSVGRHVRRRGEEVTERGLLAAAGTRVRPGLVGLALSLGIVQLPIRVPHRVAVVVTGDELQTGEAPARGTGAIRESNGAMLAAELDALGVEVTGLWRSGDDPAELRDVLARSADGADLVVTTGGVGHGAHDVVKAALQDTSCFAHLAMRPGGPQGYGRLPGGTPAVHLPGTPVGALVGMHLFVRPLLGAPGAELRLPVTGPALPPATPGRLHVLPGRLTAGGVALVPGHRLRPYAQADALILHEEAVQDGTVAVLPLLA
ncbi:molybdopterin molybdotransferase MoeA [Brachybacterium sp. EF45031]|uniref:molybdopterin molybdotransferase MoeA n=1 Tax=Brachybacterium sillae TaxID=2810536 RepID=UPI00217D3203|nr:molybdopterin molybdotransferase MoeA [Brachybacterium sillae]MCS6711387.1 molybdopterin molybdotransferase MoeA [Brachybacterium sillae]